MHGILCFGDSITFGMGESPSIGWAGRLKNYFEDLDYYNDVFNLGIPGNTTEDLLKRFDVESSSRILRYLEDNKFLIIIAIGINDSKYLLNNGERTPCVDIEKFKENIKKLYVAAKKNNCKLAFISPTPVNEELTNQYEDTVFQNNRIKEYNDSIKEICKGVPFLNMFEIMLKEDYKQMLDDGLHPNEKGYDFMFEAIKQFLIDNDLLS